MTLYWHLIFRSPLPARCGYPLRRAVQLETVDIRNEDGISYIDVTDQSSSDATKKTQKTAFHSLRHNFKDALHAAEVPAHVQDNLMGHAEGSGAKYIYGSGIPSKTLEKSIKKLKYPINFGHLSQKN